ncbi:MAG: hypothetical protein WCO98_07135 [bacterium]
MLLANIMGINTNKLARFGFSFARGGVHTARTMMLEELRGLLSYVNRPDAVKTDYLRAIDEDNCLGKRSGKTRILTYQHLVELYTLNPSILIYRNLLFFWQRDLPGQPLLALLCTYSRDLIFRSTAPFILKFSADAIISRQELEDFIDNKEPGRFSKATLTSTAQNINSTWTKSGHLIGTKIKRRSQATTTAGSVAYALLLAYLTGERGKALFNSEYIKLLDCTVDRAIELAEDASRKGWIVFKRVGDVMEVLFPNLITPEEMEWVREQS